MAEIASDPNDFVRVLETLTNFIENERIRSYNEGVDAERDRCARIAAVFIEDDGKKGTLQQKIAARIRDDDY